MTDRQTDRHTGRETEHGHKHIIYIHTYIYIYIYICNVFTYLYVNTRFIGRASRRLESSKTYRFDIVSVGDVKSKPLVEGLLGHGWIY